MVRVKRTLSPQQGAGTRRLSPLPSPPVKGHCAPHPVLHPQAQRTVAVNQQKRVFFTQERWHRDICLGVTVARRAVLRGLQGSHSGSWALFSTFSPTLLQAQLLADLGAHEPGGPGRVHRPVSCSQAAMGKRDCSVLP